MAFHIQDDVLNTYSDTNRLGKMVGSDIAGNKKTFLLTSVMNLASKSTKEELTKLLTKDIAPDKKYIRVKAICDSMVIMDLANRKVKEYCDSVGCEVENIGVESERKEILKNYINKLFARQY